MHRSTDRRLSRRRVIGAIGAAAATLPLSGLASSPADAAVRVRADIATTSGQKMLALFKRAVGIMKQKPEWDPSSWLFQANVHSHPYLDDNFNVTDDARAIFKQSGATSALRTLALGSDGSGQDGIWNTCSHFRDYPEHFVSWHRLYLYHFERIVEHIVGQPFVLPYWNYTDPKSPAKRMMPKEFAKAKAGQPENPLWYPDRNPQFLAKGLRVEDIRARASLDNPVYLDTPVQDGDPQPGFNAAIDQQPHGQVHVRVGTPGGGMQSIQFAARDPLFWVHHANIDRLWESWRRPRADGSSDRDPTDSSWLGRSFTFAAPDGSPVSMTVQQGLDIKKGLSFSYDRLQNIKLVTLAVAVSAAAGPVKSTTLSASKSDTSVAISGQDTPYTIDIAPAAPAAQSQSLVRNPSAHFRLVLGVEASKNPGCVYDVFLKVKKSVSSQETEEVFLETFNLFGAGHGPHAKHHPITWQTDITDLVRKSKFDPAVPGQVVVRCKFADPIAPAVIKSVTVQAQ